MCSSGYPSLIRALTHPLRAQILGVLQERRASPSELADEFGVPLGNVSYHVRVLADLELIRLVKRTPRRGAIEHHYEAVPVLHLGRDLWGKAPPIVRQALAGATLQDVARSVTEAASQGGFDRERAHLTRSRLVLDERGWRELAGELASTLELAERVQRESAKRLKTADHQGETKASLVMMFFQEATRPEEPTSDTAPADDARCVGEGQRGQTKVV